MGKSHRYGTHCGRDAADRPEMLSGGEFGHQQNKQAVQSRFICMDCLLIFIMKLRFYTIKIPPGSEPSGHACSGGVDSIVKAAE